MELRSIILLTEAISVSRLEPGIRKILCTTLVKTLGDVSKQVVKTFYDSYGEQSGELNSTANSLTNAITELWLDDAMRELQTYLTKQTGVKLFVRFDRSLTVMGQANGNELVLQREYVKTTIVKRIVDKAIEMIYSGDTVETINDKISEFVRSLHGTTVADVYDDGAIGRIADTAVHELVHVIQHHKQRHRPSLEYRSYLQKSRNKFYAIVNSMLQDEMVGDEEYKTYRASPQEIAAFAHDLVSRLMRSLYIDDIITAGTPKEQLKKDVVSELNYSVDRMFNNKSSRKEYAVFKRYHKLVYLEAMRYIDDAYDRLNGAT